MKKIFTTLCSLTALCTLGLAQPVLNYSATHGIGTTSVLNLIGGTTTTLQQKGAGITWDLSSNTLTQAGTFDIVAPSTTPSASSYPTANLCYKQNITGLGISYTYLIDSTIGLSSIADGISGSNPTTWTKYDKILQYPFNYMDSFTATRKSSTGSDEPYTRTYDAYGTLKINGKTYTNIIRVTKNPGNSIWFTTSPAMFPVLIQANSTTYLYNDYKTTTSIDKVTPNNQTSIYPNPFNASAIIQLNSSINNGELYITNACGQNIKTIAHISGNNIKINRDNLSSGIYFYQLMEGNNYITVGKFVITD